uniref:Cleavage/polyadenylation specificity factor A subunit N-terminal domain-containing protein n=1 Tax=Ascaris lumbricoides TaxID=6252 RepID=A0A9J2PUR9_ASCLU
MLITATCTVGNPCMIEESPLGAVPVPRNRDVILQLCSVSQSTIPNYREIPVEVFFDMVYDEALISEGERISKSGGSTYMSKTASLTETVFAEAVMLVESENEASEWSTNTGGSDYERPGDEPTLEDEWATELKGATKFEDKPGEFIAVNYDPSPVGVVLLQCFRLPPEFDESSMKVEAIVTTGNGMTLIVAVSHDSDSSEPAQSAALVYRLIFTHYVTSLEVRSFSSFIGSRGSLCWIRIGNERAKMFEEKVKYVTLMDNSKCALLTEAGKLFVVQLEQTCSRRAAEEEDEDATVTALLGDMHTSPTASARISKHFLTFSCATSTVFKPALILWKLRAIFG